MSDEIIEMITQSMIAPHPNTYTYTKAIAETLLVDLCSASYLPCAIVRPSIVGASWQQPIAVSNLFCNCGMSFSIGLCVTPNLWNCPFHEISKRIAQFAKWADTVAQFVKWALCLPISRTGQYRCRFREMGIRKPAHFTKWANVVNEIYIFVHAVAMHEGAVRQGRRLYIFKVFIELFEYHLNLGSGCISMLLCKSCTGTRGVATGCTGVDMSTPLWVFLKLIQIRWLFSGGGGEGRSGLELDSPVASVR